MSVASGKFVPGDLCLRVRGRHSVMSFPTLMAYPTQSLKSIVSEGSLVTRKTRREVVSS